MDMRTFRCRQAPPISFTYRNGSGVLSEHTLLYWQENTQALQGRERTGAFASFRKAQIVTLLSGAEFIDQAPVQTAPNPWARAEGGFSPRIYFLGFTAEERAPLELLAAEKGLHVMPALTRYLEFCCCGQRVRWRDLQQAFDRRAWVLHPQQLRITLETGQLPEHHPWLF